MFRWPLILLLGFLLACENEVRFEVPQPEGQDVQPRIPKKMYGTYISLRDSSRLTISSSRILATSEVRFRVLLSALDSADELNFRKDTLVRDPSGADYWRSHVEGDSVFIVAQHTDTIFNMNRGDVLKRFQGYYFLNREVDSAEWKVTKLGLKKDKLLLGHISNENDLDRLRDITHEKVDTTYHFKPTRKQIRKFIRDDGFENEEWFVKEKTTSRNK